MARPKNKREVRLSINVTPELEYRLNNLSDVAGHPEGVVASLALAIGLKALEQSILGFSADTIAQAAGAIRGSTEQDMVEAVRVPQQEMQKQDTKRPMSLELETVASPRAEWTGYMSGL